MLEVVFDVPDHVRGIAVLATADAEVKHGRTVVEGGDARVVDVGGDEDE